MNEKAKILLCGDAEGKFRTLFDKIETINRKSGPFDLVLCVGNFFGVNNVEFEEYKRGIRKVSVPTYILGPNREDVIQMYSEESELCPNVSYLGKRGLYFTGNRLKIAYLSGVSTKNQNFKDYNYSADDALALKDLCVKDNMDFRGIDILLTSQWPNNINNLSDSIKIENGSDIISWLSVQLKPRYHICGMEGIFYERSPYRTTNDNNSPPTRFIALGRVANKEKQKWVYALQLKPIDKMNMTELLQKTTDETNCPYDIPELERKVFPGKRKSENQQYFYDLNAPNEEKKEKRIKKQKVEYDQDKCWFCLASPSVEKHLIITVGTHAYVALAKGGIVDEHFLISPIEHHRNSIDLPMETLKEIEQFKKAIKKFYGRNNDSIGIFFERNFRTSHMQIQCIPVPKQAQNELEDIFQEEAEGHGFKLEQLDSVNRLDQVIPVNCPFFYLELNDGSRFYSKIKTNHGFPMNFAREVIATGPILNCVDRIEWKDCVLSREDEDLLVKRLRKEFEPYDISES